MNKLTFSNLFFALILFANLGFAQEYKFNYQRNLEGITDGWHSIEIPVDAYSKLNSDFSDVRILGILANGDTVEAPYIIQVQSDSYDNKVIDFNLINEVKKSGSYYYTFELPNEQMVNSVSLSFNRSNFNWLVTLEGSQNQQEWFTILKKNRIVGIENNNTSYQYTTLEFKNVSYKYLRLKIPSSKNPRFNKATIEEKILTKGVYTSPMIESFKVVEHNERNETEVLLSLQKMEPISFIKLQIVDSMDYYRPVSVEYAIDSIKNNKGWQYLYRSLFTSTLSSLNKKGYNFPNQVLKHLRITIKNYDNEPLTFSKAKIHGNPHKLIARFTKPATYYLVYGNKRAYVPNYDITRFEDNIPKKNKQLIVGDEVFIEEEVKAEKEALFKDDIWLWAIMIFAVFILGWFSLKMLKN
ncbi:hypothetical protein MNBD_BACTEROID06-1518 [hydrothermal vent metagenome]|uniref:DUF3999 family protein n=1 Tax=hydrothermal vent metagenome TaxID=652676 RepID=A0A3B0UT69_9ZZZZ